MKTLEQFLTESLINEAFASSIIENITWKGVLDPNYGFIPQWSKIKDNDLTEVTYDQAIKMYRKKDAPYILWVSKNDYRTPEGKIVLITWGTDVVWTSSRRRAESTKAEIYSISCEKAYVLANPSDLAVWKIQQERSIAKSGAKALMSAEEIRDKNLERYKKALAAKHTGDVGAVTKKLEEAMNLYSETVKNFIVKFNDMLIVNSPSTIKIKKLYKDLSVSVSTMLDKAESLENWRKEQGWETTAKKYYDEVINYCNKIAELCTKLNEEQA